ncbi:hypothetical protein [Caenimonas koreensis]|uniref:hypothetical protein n=1 Tax=Caenimonas koreensis TaxID=367474 RepID=UPI003783FA34
MAMNTQLKLVCMALALISTFFLGSAGQRISLIADGALVLYDKPMDGAPAGTIAPGATVPVVGCEDLKHYIVPIVVINGHEAYVRDGVFRMQRQRVWDFAAGPISFSCP